MNHTGELKGKVCLVTGANAGLGRVTAYELAKRSATVVLLCRSPERGAEARAALAAYSSNPRVDLLVCDLSSLEAVRATAAKVLDQYPRLDVLVNNAAIYAPAREVTVEGFELTFVTNYLSHFLLTNLLLDRLKASAPSRVVNVVSKPGGMRLDFDDLQSMTRGYSAPKAVARSKLAEVLFTRELSRRLEGTRVTVNATHPGLVKTTLRDDMGFFTRTAAHLFSAPPEVGAEGIVYLATSAEVSTVTGKMFEKFQQLPYEGQAGDWAAVHRLWDESARLAGVCAAPHASVATRQAATPWVTPSSGALHASRLRPH